MKYDSDIRWMIRIGATSAGGGLMLAADVEFDRDCAELRRKVDEEVRLYRFRGRPWTPYRRFYSGLEMIGAALCGRHGRSRKHRAAYVSYCTGLPGRTVICELCFQKDRRSVLHVVERQPLKESTQ